MTSNSVTQITKQSQLVGGGIVFWGLVCIWVLEEVKGEVFLGQPRKRKQKVKFLGRNWKENEYTYSSGKVSQWYRHRLRQTGTLDANTTFIHQSIDRPFSKTKLKSCSMLSLWVHLLWSQVNILHFLSWVVVLLGSPLTSLARGFKDVQGCWAVRAGLLQSAYLLIFAL